MTRKPSHPLPRGTRIITVRGEIDEDSDEEQRITAPGTVGTITGYAKERENGDAGFCYDIEFPNGAWVTRDDNEVDDPARYRLAES